MKAQQQEGNRLSKGKLITLKNARLVLLPLLSTNELLHLVRQYETKHFTVIVLFWRFVTEFPHAKTFFFAFINYILMSILSAWRKLMDCVGERFALLSIRENTLKLYRLVIEQQSKKNRIKSILIFEIARQYKKIKLIICHILFIKNVDGLLASYTF